MKPWIAKKVIEIIRVDDDIVVEFVYSMLEDRDNQVSLSFAKYCLDRAIVDL